MGVSYFVKRSWHAVGTLRFLVAGFGFHLEDLELLTVKEFLYKTGMMLLDAFGGWQRSFEGETLVGIL